MVDILLESLVESTTKLTSLLWKEEKSIFEFTFIVANGTKISGCVSVKNSGNSSIRTRKDRRISALDERKSLASLETHAFVVIENFLSIIQ